MEWLTGTAAIISAVTALIGALGGLVGYKVGKSAALKVRDERSKVEPPPPVKGEVVVKEGGR